VIRVFDEAGNVIETDDEPTAEWNDDDSGEDWKDGEFIENLPVHHGFRNVAKSIDLRPDRLAYLLCYTATRYPLLARFVLRFNRD
jgi:hypothetical protein